MQGTQLCERCGYDLPGGAEECPGCRGQIVEVTRAARQVAGLDLPTRSVHALSAVTPIREARGRRPLGRQTGAADLLAFTMLLALLAAAAWFWAIVAHTDRFATQLGRVTLQRLDLIVVILAWATLATAALTALAVLARALRVIRRRR